MPRSRRMCSVDAMSAEATPRFRHGRRTEMCSSHAILRPSFSFSSALIDVMTEPATSSPSQATCHSDVSSVGEVIHCS
jgi:hypothetical protein